MKIHQLLCSAVLFVVFGCGTNTSPGSGEKIGQIVRLSRVGLSSKTWEAQLIRGGITDGSGAFGTVPFNFTIESDDLAEKARGFMQTNTEVSLRYRTEGIYSACRSESGGDFAVSIDAARK